MRFTLSFLFLMAFTLFVDASEKPRAQRVDRDAVRYEMDSRRARDLQRAFSILSSKLSDDHYVEAVLDYRLEKGWGVIQVEAEGELVVLSFRHIEDDDKTRSLLLRARNVLRLDLKEKPW